MTRRRSEIALRIAAVLALVALAFMVWSVIDPHPMPVVLAMSVGQGLGTLSFLIFATVVAADLRKRRILSDIGDHSGSHRFATASGGDRAGGSAAKLDAGDGRIDAGSREGQGP